MAAPIGNDSGLGVMHHQPQESARVNDPAPKRSQPLQAAEPAPAAADTLTLSETGRQLSSAEDGRHVPQTPEEAQRLVAQIKEKIAANPGFAAAVHKVSDASRLATLLDGFA